MTIQTLLGNFPKLIGLP